MKILIDALTAREGGGITYLEQIVPALVRARPAHEFHLLLSNAYQSTLIDVLAPLATIRPVSLGAGSLLRRLDFLARVLPRVLDAERYDLLFSVSETACPRPSRPHVVLARNFSIFAPLRVYGTPGARRQALLYRATREPLARAALRGATHVAFVSESYRAVVLERLSIDSRRTSVVHHGVHPSFASDAALPRPSFVDDRPYLLCVSSLAPHKNHEILLRAYASARRRSPTPALVIAGAATDDGYARSLHALAASLNIGADVNFLGRVPHAELPALYRHASAFVFPSRLETFGQPLLEAMSGGTAVLASDSATSHELCGDAAHYFDAASVSALEESLRRLLDDRRYRRELTERGRTRARDFTWEKAAGRMLEIFDRAAAGT